jgi:hypothetical protein
MNAQEYLNVIVNWFEEVRQKSPLAKPEEFFA